MNDMKARVASRYLRKIAEEKSLNLQIDDAFKTWKGTNPITKKEVGYWTVKGWKQLSKKTVSKDSDKARLKEYALKAFKEFEKKVKGENESSGEDTQEIRDSIRAMINRPNLGLPEKVFKDNRFGLEVKKPSRKEVEELAKDIKRTFRTPNFERGTVGQLIATLGTDEWAKRHLSMVVKPIQGVLAKVKKDEDYKEAIAEAMESNPEVSGAAKNLSANWTQSTVIPMITSLATGTQVSVGAGVKAVVTAGLTSAGVGGTVATVAPIVASLAVGVVMYKKLFHQRSKKTKGKLRSLKERGLPDNYDDLASDIFAGYATPESVEDEYSKKLDAILNDSNLDPDEARKKILELYEDFDTNARPSIDKGLYQLGATEGVGKLEFLKRGAEEKKGTPILIKLMMIKDQYDAQDQIAKLMEDTDEVSDMLQAILTGEEEIPKEIIEGIQQSSDKKAHSMAKRVARRYLGL